MAAPTITWRKLTGNAPASAGSYASIASLDFGTVTAGAWSTQQIVAPKVTVNSIQSCGWWLNDVGAVRSSASTGIGTAGGWTHKYAFTGTYVAPATASAGFGTEVPESSGSAASYNDVSSGAYGDFIVLALKVASAAGDGLHTAWSYQLKYSYT